jgi:hypothetical protein
MLRYGLLGGERPTLPWEFFVTLGGALLLTAVLFVFLYPLWTNYFLVGLIETGIFVIAGAVLVSIGALRRSHTLRRR